MACNELAESMNKCGPALVEGQFEKIALYASDILQQKSLCQQDPDEDEDAPEQEGDSSEYESALISNASDLVGALASVLGPDFAAPFGQFLPLIRKYYVRAIRLLSSSGRFCA
jgi:importin-4